MHLGSYAIDDTLTFTCNTHTPSTGAAVDADAVPGYRVYEDETGTPLLTGSMALLDDANTTGFYSEQIALSAANGFEAGKCYTVRITGVVGGVTGVTERCFQVGAKVDASASAVASVTAGVSLADDAITASKFDESTAFPLKSADTGATAVARTGADSDTLETLSDQIDALTPSGGDGARSVLVTVTDGTDPLVDAAVRATDANGVTSWALRTDENGQCTFSLSDDTWTLAASLTGYSHTPEELVVDGNKTRTLEMTLVVVPEGAPAPMSNGYLYTYDEDNELEGSVSLEFVLVAGPGTAAAALYGKVVTATSNGAGLLIRSLLRSGTYRARRGTGAWVQFTVTNTPTFAIPEILGR